MTTRQARFLGLVLLAGLLAASAPALAQRGRRAPQLVASSQAKNLAVVGGEIELVDTADRSPLYRLRFELSDGQQPLAELGVEYELQDVVSQSVLGGGFFTVRPSMIDRRGREVTALVGFDGVELRQNHLVLARLVDAPWAPKSGITDTCTTFCDHCSDKAEAVCTAGVAELNCNCSDNHRTCSYKCVIPRI